ncbi:R3H domain-containing protein 1 [Carex littledalei]|uniref:R3H domain-containing protein 1 n=1 Tax=Carex littledalei TaxID=544730 RepID=A0A833REN6_9POAL|nr:R3H domain-containing protein 1 [Carex littledalei]
MNQFAMVEELASLVKDNLYSKHLILSTEEALVAFLQQDTSTDGSLELQPVGSYHRLLLHRLAEIYGFVHESVGEGEDRHLVLERCPETAIPSVLVSDILWDHAESYTSTSSQHILKRENPDTLASKLKHSMSLIPTPTPPPLEERQAAYLAARNRIFGPSNTEEGRCTSPKLRKDPAVARRMIAHALGRKLEPTSDPDICGSEPNSGRRNDSTPNNGEKRGNNPRALSAESLKKEQLGAAKRMFANALGRTSFTEK